VLDRAYQGSQMVDVAGCRICYLRKGSGPPLVLVHGVPLSLLTWRHVIDTLSQRFTVVAVDLKGFGRSQKPHGDYSAEAHGRLLAAFVGALDLEAATIVGSSYGCAPAIYAALASPERIARLVLINSVGGLANRHRVERVLRIAGVLPVISRMLGRTGMMRRIFGARLRACYVDPRQLPSDLVEAYLELFDTDRGRTCFLSTLRDFDERRLADHLSDITQRVLVVWGEQDRVLPIDAGHRLSARIRHAQFAALSNCAHFPHEESPSAFAALVDQFVGVPAAVSAER
jgi:pimeloyl-ACP methyl ester carboxylesterase